MADKLSHLAPCGMNCETCMAYLRKKNKCAGCRATDGFKPYHCTVCSILLCNFLAQTSSGFCYECTKYPCTRLKSLDKRYREKYKTSLMANLEVLKSEGTDVFMARENERWRCSSCGGTICVHTGTCFKCEA